MKKITETAKAINDLLTAFKQYVEKDPLGAFERLDQADLTAIAMNQHGAAFLVKLYLISNPLLQNALRVEGRTRLSLADRYVFENPSRERINKAALINVLHLLIVTGKQIGRAHV